MKRFFDYMLLGYVFSVSIDGLFALHCALFVRETCISVYCSMCFRAGDVVSIFFLDFNCRNCVVIAIVHLLF